MEHRVLIYAPVGKDARLVSQLLERAGVECFICLHSGDVARELERGVGTLFIVEEALTVNFLTSVAEFLVRRSLVELHGGTVSCSSSGIGQGSHFAVLLPRPIAGNEHSERPGKTQQTHLASRPLRILVVDDNVDAATTLAMYLEALGHKVLVEHRACDALQCAKREAPEVLMLDIGLPEMDGNELARRLRCESETSGSLLIAVTGYGQDQDRIKALDAGFDHHLVKPLDIRKLSVILNSLENA